MIKEIDMSNHKLAKEIFDIQIPSYLVEAEIIGMYDIPPLRDTVESILLRQPKV